MNREMVETYRYLRDNGKPISQRDAADYAAIRAPQPPSRALLKRVKRAQLGLNPRREGEIREYSQVSPEIEAKKRQLAFHRKVISQLGGSLTIAPAAEYVRPPIQYHDAQGPIKHQSERDALTEASRRLQRQHMIAMSRRLYVDDQPDMFEVLDNFGSFKRYSQEIK